jgi:hypothetical protein
MKIINAKINILHLFYLIIILLPLVDTILRVRIGAGWQLYIPLIFLLFLSLVVKYKDFSKYFSIAIIVIIFLIFSNIIGYIQYYDYKLPDMLISQVGALEYRMIVESIRYLSALFFFISTLYLVRNTKVLGRVLIFFLYSVLIQSVYGIYEFLVKKNQMILPLLSERSSDSANIRVYGTFYEPSQYGQFMLIGLLVLILYKCLTYYNNNIDSSIFTRNYKAFLVLFFISIILSFSRAAFVILIAVLFIYFILSMTKFRKIISIISMCVFIGVIFFIYIKFSLSMVEYERWLALLSADTGNGLVARINMVFDSLFRMSQYVVNNPFGVGSGTVQILGMGAAPIIFRFFVEQGIFIGILYVVFLWSILVRVKMYSIEKNLKISIYLLFTAMLMVQANYNSTVDPWFWFILAILFKAPYILKRQKKYEK